MEKIAFSRSAFSMVETLQSSGLREATTRDGLFQ